jgi:hypothetical protein
LSVSGNKADLYDRTNPDWAPSLKLGPDNLSRPILFDYDVAPVSAASSSDISFCDDCKSNSA